MKIFKNWSWGISALLLLTTCSLPEDVPVEQMIVSDFENSQGGWSGDYVEYFASMESGIEFDLTRTTLPTSLSQERMAMKIEGRNSSDDLFMFMKKQVTGLDPTQTYEVYYEIELASNYATNSVGIGGSPGASVFLKAGASPEEPIKVLRDNNYFEVTINKGNQSQPGSEMYVLGHVGTGNDVEGYRIIQRENSESPLLVSPDSQGNLWLCVGTDSGFEGKTTLYYDKILAVLRPVGT